MIEPCLSLRSPDLPAPVAGGQAPTARSLNDEPPTAVVQGTKTQPVRRSLWRSHAEPTAGVPQVARYRAGMPQLSRHGLSEHWLLKECGHRQWLGIARGQGSALPEFRDSAGNKAYAAFTLVRIAAPALDAIGENERFAIASDTLRVGRSQHYGRHEVHAGGRMHARVEMLSVFVRRERPGENASIVRAALAESDIDLGAAKPALRRTAQHLIDRGRAFRTDTWRTDDSVAGERSRVLRHFAFNPCPITDFNGADLLYFASFQAIVDRAEWAWFGTSHRLVLVKRELAFHANVDVGESLEVRLHAAQHSEGGLLKHWCALHRKSDGRLLADVLTIKAALDKQLL